MKQKTVLFDLDGTLAPMDQDAFTKGYFYPLGSKTGPPMGTTRRRWWITSGRAPPSWWPTTGPAPMRRPFGPN